MRLRTDIDGWLAVTNTADTYAVILATAPDYDISKADGFTVMIVTPNAEILGSKGHETLQDALRDFITHLDKIVD